MKTKQERFAHLFGTLAEKQLFNGVVLAAENGKVIYQAAYGVADLASGRKLEIDSVFELASVSKPITALGMIKLVEQGKASYDEPIGRWLPDLPYKGITIRHLLNHTSGLPDYMELFSIHWDRTKIATNQDVLKMLIAHRPPVYFEPNESWLYSNTGYVLLAILIEKIAGKSFSSYLKEELFTPLGMNHTQVYNRRYRKEQIENYAYGYVYDLHADCYALPDFVADMDYVVYLDGIQGDGTVNSTLADLLKLDQALYTGQLVSGETWQEMVAPVHLNNGETFDYGFGWLLEENEEKGRIMSHTGGWPGYSTMLSHYHDHNKTLMILRNFEQEAEFEQAVNMAAENILFDLPSDLPTAPPKKKLANIDPAIYSAYVGNYVLDNKEQTALTVTTEEGRLYLQAEGNMRVELYPLTDTRFFVRSVPIEVEFVPSETKCADSIMISEDGHRSSARRA
ncbi:serine hydrolase [Brevibacillus fluminis]|uniref:serine hydrolase n=1 Tax=Brevibacillus fluminis TaxID=511487 RepID=UPI003F8AFEDF